MLYYSTLLIYLFNSIPFLCHFLWLLTRPQQSLLLILLLSFVLFERFSHLSWPMVSHWSLSDNKSPQVSRPLFSILADLNNAVIWMVITRPVIFKSSYPCTNRLVIVSSVPITIGIIVTFMFHSVFNSLSKVDVLISIFIFFQFHSVVRWDWKFHNSKSSPFCWLFSDINIIIIILILLLLWWWSLEFFSSALADGLSLEFEWQQVSSRLQDSSQYSGRS